MLPRFLSSFALFIAMAIFVAFAADPNQLNDFCVATNDPNNAVLMNGEICKNPSEVTADDFLFRGLHIPSNTSNTLFGCNNIPVFPAVLPGLNGLGIMVTRFDYAPRGGLMAPHTHARATEVLTLLEGSLYVGFVSFNQSTNSARLFSKVLSPGDVFVFPQALIHFGFNMGEVPAAAFAAFNSQNPGNDTTATGVFGTHPPISVDLLSKAFQLDPNIVQDLQSKF